MRVFYLIAPLGLAACATTAPAPVAAPVAPIVSTATPAPQEGAADAPSGMQWMYGSAEGASASIQTYRALERFVAAAVASRPQRSVVLEESASVASPTFVSCAGKPLAIILDADETAIQNQGLEYALARKGVNSDRPTLNAWQRETRARVPAMPGAPEALARIRAMGVKVVYNTNRDNPHAAATAASLNAAGVGPARHLDTLFLRGDVDGKSGKDGRRLHVAQSHCVIAMAGDQMGDFTDLLNERGLTPLVRRALASSGVIGDLWGNGWFLLSNPVYGPGLRGTIDEVFAPDMRWQAPAQEESK
jgi:predicted secreted acid phosphatase